MKTETNIPAGARTHEVTGGFMKHAWIRNADVPQGQPALGRINCPCGNAPESAYSPESGDVTCGCGTIYSWNGWIVSQGAKINAMISDAAEAIENFSEDDLEAFAANSRK